MFKSNSELLLVNHFHLFISTSNEFFRNNLIGDYNQILFSKLLLNSALHVKFRFHQFLKVWSCLCNVAEKLLINKSLSDFTVKASPIKRTTQLSNAIWVAFESEIFAGEGASSSSSGGGGSTTKEIYGEEEGKKARLRLWNVKLFPIKSFPECESNLIAIKFVENWRKSLFHYSVDDADCWKMLQSYSTTLGLQSSNWN